MRWRFRGQVVPLDEPRPVPGSTLRRWLFLAEIEAENPHVAGVLVGGMLQDYRLRPVRQNSHLLAEAHHIPFPAGIGNSEEVEASIAAHGLWAHLIEDTSEGPALGS